VTVRPAARADLDAVLDLQLDYHRAVYGEPCTDAERLVARWPEQGHWVVEAAGGGVDGYGRVAGHGDFEAWVRPGTEDAGVGETLMAAIGSHHPGRLETVVRADAAGTLALLERSGFDRIHDVLEMQIDLRPPLSAPRWPDGVSVRAYDDARDARGVHACLAEAFAASDEQVAPFAEWHRWLVTDPSFDPAVVFVAQSADEVAGVAQCWAEGFVKDLAVRPAHRGRGLGEALLRHVFREFHRRGAGSVALKVDASNATGAVRLYRRVGMREVRRHAVYARG